MITQNHKPVIFLAFANDRDDAAGYLRNLPETLVNEFSARQISENEIQQEVLATLIIWLKQNDSQSRSRFGESAVPFARRLITQNRELFETLARS